MKKPRATFRLSEGPHHCLHIVDLDGPVSVTNDADNVVPWVMSMFVALARKKGGGSAARDTPRDTRIFYKDTDGRWDELDHDGYNFTTFKPITEEDRLKFGVPTT